MFLTMTVFYGVTQVEGAEVQGSKNLKCLAKLNLISFFFNHEFETSIKNWGMLGGGGSNFNYERF